jgi:hypothetical protein
MKHLKKAQFGALIKAGAKAAVKKAPRTAKSAFKGKQLKEGLNSAFDKRFPSFEKDLKSAITNVERNALKKRFQDIDKGLDKTSSPSEKISNAVKPKMQAGGVVKTQPKRVGPIDPKGAYTKVQERTLRGDKVAAPKLTKDKELGATKMKKGGKVSKKK